MSRKLGGAGEYPVELKVGSVRREVVLVRIDDLVEGQSPRLDGIDDAHVEVLAEVEAPLPPICVHHETMRIVDGAHRVRAARLNGREVIEAWFFRGSLEDAFCLAVRENMTHGLPLTTTDRRTAAARILSSRPDLSDRAIALATGIAARTVASVRRSVGETTVLSARVGRDGRVRPLDATEGRRRAGEIVRARPGASLREIAREAGVSVGTARDVRTRVRTGEDPVPSAKRAGRRSDGTEATARPRPVINSRLAAPPSAVDLYELLDGLRRDPSLRYTDSGRAFLRWFLPQVDMVVQWPSASSVVPPHCNVVVARVARECARMWSEMADHLGDAHSECA